LIVVKTEDEAKDVLARLRKGEAFAKLATDKSIDPSKKDGGDVGWVLPSQILPAISNVMVNLSKGGLSAAPIQTPAGWNIIRLDDTRTFKAPTLEESKENVRQMLMQQKRMAYIKKLRDAAKVTN
jgi:peptidyl-prolyl cis-trans isomerase C